MKKGLWQWFKSSRTYTKVNIVCTVLIASATVIYAIIAGCTLIAMNGELSVMQGTLAEQKRSGQQSTLQMWSAIDNINWMGRSMDLSEKQTEGSIQAARDQFQQDERPYIWLAPKDVTNGNSFWTPTWTNNDFGGMNSPQPWIGRVRWEWHVINYGKTPAYHVRYSSYLRVGNAPFLPARGVGIPQKSAPIPPSAGLWTATESNPNIEQDRFGDNIGLKVHIFYDDAAGKAYETDICLLWMRYCAQGNEIK